MPRTHAYTTITELKDIFAKRSLHPRKSMGQNFLFDRNLLQAVADAAEIEAGDVVLEIGSGTGALTEILAARAKTVIAVEYDPDLFAITRSSLAPLENIQVIHADILGAEKLLNPEVVAALQATGATSIRVVGDIPYYISSPLVIALLACPIPVTCMALTVQREVAVRLAARTGTKDYGFISVLVQTHAQSRIVRTLPAHVFWPKPKVASAVVQIKPLAAQAQVLHIAGALERVASALFHSRRKDAAKTMALAGIAPTKEAAQQMLVAVGANPNAKSDSLTPEQVLRIAEQCT